MWDAAVFLFAPQPRRGFAIHAALRLERDAIDLVGNAAAQVTLAHIVRLFLRVALLGRTEAAAAAGAKSDRVAGVELFHEHLGVGKVGDFLAADTQADLVARSRSAAGQSPGRAVHAIDLHVDVDGRARLHHLLGAQAAAVAARAAGILAQRVPLEKHRVLRFHLLHRMVVRVAVVQAHRRAHADLGELRAETAPGRADACEEQPPVLRRDAVAQAGEETGMVPGDGAVRDRLFPCPEYRVDN